MRKENDRTAEDSSHREPMDKKVYVRPELVKRENLALATGETTPPQRVS